VRREMHEYHGFFNAFFVPASKNEIIKKIMKIIHVMWYLLKCESASTRAYSTICAEIKDDVI
jgi:hypothetical protein